ncbi:translocation/assembly module TamB domain-containing protein [Thermus oshimai]|uniref:translocation/assembly module TamB domain-containing protein n=1 Tax=Thermus oshimai TaxID=56957 RepID=UPI0039A76896
MRRLLFLLPLLFLLALPAWPPLLQGVVRWGLEGAGFSGKVEGVRGYLLLGLRLQGVDLRGEGLSLKAEEVEVAYDLLGLLRRELPLSLRVRKGLIRPTWEALIPEKPGPPPPIRTPFRSLVLEEVAVELPKGERLFLPPLRLTLEGQNPYRFLARLPGGTLEGEARALSQDLSAWRVAFRGGVGALSFFYPGLLGGALSGEVEVGPKGILGRARVEGGAVELVGFRLSGVGGEVRLLGGRAEAELRGEGLEGPLAAWAEVDWGRAFYRFRLEGRPRLQALARHYGLELPLEGEGLLRLEGSGWERLALEGTFEGEGRLLGEPFRHRGRLGFDGVFSLEALAEGRLFDRTYALDFALRGQAYRAHLRDSRGSALRLEGEGVQARGEGAVAWPRPLEGLARVRFLSEGSRFRVGVESPGVRLPLFQPLDLSGSLEGEGGRVRGRLGPLAFFGPWSDLALSLKATPLLLGALEGEGRLRLGRLRADLRYDSPYARLPLFVVQEEGGFRFLSPYGEGRYRKGVLDLVLRDLPLSVLDTFRLSGRARYGAEGLSGSLSLKGRYLEAEAHLRGLGAELRGAALTPLGRVPLEGVYDPERGLDLRAGGLGVRYREGLRVVGKGALGPLLLEADLAYREGFSGWARFRAYGVEGRLLGEGPRLSLSTWGWVEAEGEVYPSLRLSGRLVPPAVEGLALPPLPLRLDREGLRVEGVGEVAFRGGFPFRLRLPFAYRGQEGVLEAEGDLQGGRAALKTPYGALSAQGPWRGLRLQGEARLPALGAGALRGEADLLALRYRGEARFPALALAFSGEGLRVRFQGAGPGLRLSGGYEGALRLDLRAEGLDLSPFGLLGKVSGAWGEGGGRLLWETPYGRLEALGHELLKARLRFQGPYGEGEGEASPEGLSARLEGGYRQGGVALRLEASGGGPWTALAFALKGRAEAPYLEPVDLEGRARLEGGRFRYALEGPIRLEGEGLGYRGAFRLPFRLLERVGALEGAFRGEGLKVSGEGEGVWAGLPFRFRGGYGEGAFLEVAYEGSHLRLLGDEVAFRLDLGPLGKALGLPLGGRAEGALDLRGGGEAQGEVAYGGEAFRFRYGEGTLRLLWREVGLAWTPGTGALQGLGALSGTGRLDLGGRRLEGAFRYRDWELKVEGPWNALGLEARHAGEGLGETRLSARLDLLAQKGEGQLRHRSSYAEGALDLLWSGTGYRGQGFLRSLAYLEQEGPVELLGEGARVRATWHAPFALEARYEEGLHLHLKGQGAVEGVALQADLAYGPGGYRGGFRAEGLGLRLEGAGEGPLRLRLSGRVGPGAVRGEGLLQGLSLSGRVGLDLPLLKGGLKGEAELFGTLPDLRAEGRGALEGEGLRLPFRLAYRQGGGAYGVEALSLEVWGEGLDLALEGGRLKAQGGLDLTPLGLPLFVGLSGEGPWTGPLSLTLRPGAGLGLEGEASGRLWLSPLRAEVRGTLLGEALEAGYGEGGLWARFLGPRVRGEAFYREGLSGRLQVRYPVPEGAVLAEADLGSGRVLLRGEGALEGGGEGVFCLPRPLGPCAGVEGEARLGLAYRGVGFRGAYRYQGGVAGEGVLSTPYGAVRAVGRGLGLDLLGVDLPLTGRLDLSPLALRYRYEGPLPRGLGVLEAEGAYPGVWLKGVYRYGEVALALTGLPGFRLRVEGDGVSGEVGPGGVGLRLQGFAYGPLRLTGGVEGSFSHLKGRLLLEAFGRRAEAEGAWREGALEARLSGDLEGGVAYRGAWEGEVAFPYGRARLSGRGVPFLEGEALGQAFRLAWPLLEVGGVGVDLARREARGSGEVRVLSLPPIRMEGEGGRVALALTLPQNPLAEGEVQGVLDLEALAFTLSATFGEGALRYQGGEVSGALALPLSGLSLRLEGKGKEVFLEGAHPAHPWWAAGEGALEGRVDLAGGYRVHYRAGPQAVELSGRFLEAELKAEGPYLRGQLRYPGEGGGVLKVDLPLAPLGARFLGEVRDGPGFPVEGVLSGEVGRLQGQGTLLPLEGRLRLEDAALEDFLGRYAPYLKGRASGEVAFKGGRGEARLEGQVGVAGETLPFSLQGGFGPRVEVSGVLGRTPLALALERGVLDLRADPRGFPLHLLLAAVAGPLEGQAYWTGALRLRLPLGDPWAGEGVLVGESLVFRGGGDELRGQAAFRYGGRRLTVDHLRLSGRGSWEGAGYWGPEGSDLRLTLKDTVYTPVLQVVPFLKPYRPQASGTLELRLTGEGFRVDLEDFAFRLGPLEGRVPKGLLALNGGARAEGELLLSKPFPGRARLGLQGTLEDFRVLARGEVSLPGLKEATPAELALRYPGYGVEIALGEAQASGTLFPLRLAGYGKLPLYYPRYYLQEGLLDVKSFFLYEEKGTYHLTGNAEVLRARLAIPEAGQRALVQEGVPTGEAPGAPLPLRFEGVRIYAERGILVQESLAQGELKGEVYLEGPYADPYLVGEVRPLWGAFRLWDAQFALEPESALRFRPDRGLLPEFALKASAQVRGYAVALEAQGEFLRENGRVKVRLEPRFTSEPPLSEPEIYALLALGTPDVTRLAETFPQVALGAVLENLLVGQLERELARALGLDRLRVELPALQGGALEDTRFSIGKYLSPELFLGYTLDLQGAQTFSVGYRRDGLTVSLGSTFLFGDGRLSRLDLELGYDLTPDLALSLGLEASDTVRFSVGALYRW